MKKGQITAFIVIGLVIVASLAAFYFARERVAEEQQELQLEQQQDFESNVQAVKIFTQSCMDNAAGSAVNFLGVMGSNFNSGAGNFFYDQVPIAYLHEGTDNYLPSIEDWQYTLSILFSVFMQDCDYSSFENSGLEFAFEFPFARATILENHVNFDVYFPLKISSGSQEAEFLDFNTKVPVRLGYIHNATNTIINLLIEEPGYMPVTEILSFDLNITGVNFEENSTMLYVIRDVEHNDYTFIFADKYELVEDESDF